MPPQYPRSSLEFTVSSQRPDLDIAVCFDGTVQWQDKARPEPQTIRVELDDDENAHQLTITLSGKTSDHTVIDDQGQILDDLTVDITNFVIDGIDINYLVTKIATYKHDFNGTQAPGIHRFYGTLGCNGTVTLDFTAPVYLWLLENM